MADKLDPTIWAELDAAGCRSAVAALWFDSGEVSYADAATEADRAAVAAVLAAHVPAAPVRSVRGPVLVKALDKSTKVSARDLAYVGGLDAAREDMPSIARIAAVDGLNPKAWFDRALA